MDNFIRKTQEGIKGTETEKNLLKAFAGESQARTRYAMFAKIAKKEGFEQIAAIFEETAANEMAHAKSFFEFLDEGNLEITASYPAGPLADTGRNLREAAMGEHEEWAEMYPAFADIAEKEGFKRIANHFRLVATVERAHEARYNKLIQDLENGVVFADSEEVVWMCRNCGYLHRGKTAPKRCPVCDHPQGYFERQPVNY